MERRTALSMIAIIFVSLTVGIVIGAELTTDRDLVSAQLKLIAAIEQAVDRMEEDMERMKRELSQWEEKWALATDEEQLLAQDMIHGILSGHHVAIVGFEGCSLLDSISSALGHAGANIASLTPLPKSLLVEPEQVLVGLDPGFAGVVVAVCSEGAGPLLAELVSHVRNMGYPVVVATDGCKTDIDDAITHGINRSLSTVQLCYIIRDVTRGDHGESKR